MTIPTDQDDAGPAAAAMWFARMRGPDSKKWKPQFNAWMTAGPEHREAYNRLSEHFTNSDVLKTSIRFGKAASVRCRRKYLAPSAAMASVAVVMGLVWIGVPARKQAEMTGASEQPGQLLQAIGNARYYSLSDGSSVTLDSGARMHIALGADRRDLWLDAGRARFHVAHDRRPFIVHAGGGTVTARGTVFDVALNADHHVQVALIEGHIDVVAGAPGESSNAGPAMRRLNPGQAVTFSSDGNRPPGIAAIALPALTWPQEDVDYRSARLADLLAVANRSSAHPIKLADPSLAYLEVSGRFRLNNPERFADSVAQLFDLDVRKHGREIVLARKNISSPP
jgi:transmembrane sensor